MGDSYVIDQFNMIKNETYPFNHGKFESL